MYRQRHRKWYAYGIAHVQNSGFRFAKNSDDLFVGKTLLPGGRNVAYEGITNIGVC